MKLNVDKLFKGNENESKFSEILVYNDVFPTEIKVDIDFTAKLLSDEILIEGKFLADVEIECSRCLKKFSQEISGNFETVYVNNRDYEEYLSAIEDNHNFNVSETIKEPIVNGEIDIQALVREYLILNIPSYPVCSEECEGVEEAKNYENDGIDPRWQKLLNIVSED